MKTKPVTRGRKERGQAIILVLVAMGLFLMGALGLAIDGAQMFAQRQMAQTAADAAAQAGMMSIMDGTNVAEGFGTAVGTLSACTTPSDGRTPCAYAQRNGFNTTADTIAVNFIKAAGSPFSSDPVNEVKVTVSRTLNTGLIRFLGPATSTIKATATAATVAVASPVPILIMHPTLTGALTFGGNSEILITGGPSRSIEVNSSNATAISVNGNPTMDLSAAGPNGNGADWGVWGGPPSVPTNNFLAGTRPGRYLPAASWIQDPLKDVLAPTAPVTNGSKTLNYKGADCPAAACTLYRPGLWHNTDINVNSDTAVFVPGVYYMQDASFVNGHKGTMVMATTQGTDPDTGSGILVYHTGTGGFDMSGALASATLLGSSSIGRYKNILFFQDHAAAFATHKLGWSNSTVTLTGNIYLTNTRATMLATPAQYQELQLGGGGCGTTTIIGEIIVDKLSMNGTPCINMNLNALPSYTVRQIALVN
jgi:hypothetical protein